MSITIARMPFPRRTPKPPAGPRMRKCCNRSCRKPFEQFSSFVDWCSIECGAVVALERLTKQKAKAARVQRSEIRERKQAIKTRQEWLREAQAAFNAWIRARDAALPCICCGRMHENTHHTGGLWDAGHYRSVGSAQHLRFEPDNVHRQLKVCNQYGAGRAVDYRIGLIARIGLERVEALESDQTPRKWTIEELRAIKAEYKAKLKHLTKGE